MALFSELEGLPLQDLLTLFSSDHRYKDDPAEKELWLQEVAVRIAKSGAEGLCFLIRSLPSADQAELRAILLSFSFLPREVVEENLETLKRILHTFLGSTHHMLIAEAIEGLNSLGLTDVIQDVRPFLAHWSPYVVGSALRYLSWHDPERAKPVLLESLNSNEPIVRQNAIDELDRLSCSEALPYIRPLLHDEDKDVRQAAQTAICNLEEQIKEGEEPR